MCNKMGGAEPNAGEQRGKHIILYYKYARIPDVEAVREQLVQFCTANGLTGRILLADHEGINGTLAGDEAGIEAFIEMMKEHGVFRMTDDEFKHSWAGKIEEPFPDLFIKVRTVGSHTGLCPIEIRLRSH